MFERTRRVVLLIDYDNLQICASRDTPGRDLQLDPVVQLAQRYGSVIVSRAYAEWNLSTERLAVYKAGIEPAFAPVLRTESDRSGKSLADTVMVAEGMDILWTLAPDVLVLATSDKDLIPLVRVAKQRGARVIVLGSDFTAIPLREMADEHVTYKQIITEGVARTGETSAARPQVIPADGGRRSRVRDREQREPRDGHEHREGGREARPPREVHHAPPEHQVQPVEAGTVSAAEPVAPVNAVLASNGDGESSLARRRRRRGSRRRSDRLGVGGEGAELDENGAPLEAEADLEELAETEGEQQPATDVFEASSGTIEEAGEPEAEVEPIEPATPVVGPGEAQIPIVSGVEEQLAGWTEAVEARPDHGTEATPLLATEAEPQNGLATDEGAAGEEEAPPARRPRARRVASARAGRSRSAPR